MKSAMRDAALPLLGRVTRRPRSGDADRILILQPDHLGDILLSQPAVRCIRERFARAHITAAVGPWSEAAARHFWPVDDVVTLNFPGFERDVGHRILDPYVAVYREANRLAPSHFGRAVVLRSDAWWAGWLASMVAPDVVASDDPRVRPFATTIAHVSQRAHAVERAMSIARSTSGPGIGALPSTSTNPLRAEASAEDDTLAQRLLARVGIAGAYAVIHPGSGAPVKEWPVHRWRALAVALAENGIAVVVTGSERERRLAGEIVDGSPNSASVAGETPLGILIGLLSRASIAIGPDCGPLHIAVATNTPSVHLFGPSDPGRYGPWGDAMRHRVVRAGMSCERCGDLSRSREPGCGCMLAISVDTVMSIARNLINDAAA
ncbi:MAG TPA: glycosyltransferase family 9 protein [Thermomicrobiales bacterium]|nr:glycosyltransferase family 9 protein [Thermomicrobiales bacterium]